MKNSEFGEKLEKRTKLFAISILKMSAKLPASTEFNVIRNQVSKSGTSIGATYREANRARSKADFANKIKISEGEASETIYWLEILNEYNNKEMNSIAEIMKEAKEILAIFTSISATLKATK